MPADKAEPFADAFARALIGAFTEAFTEPFTKAFTEAIAQNLAEVFVDDGRNFLSTLRGSRCQGLCFSLLKAVPKGLTEFFVVGVMG